MAGVSKWCSVVVVVLALSASACGGGGDGESPFAPGLGDSESEGSSTDEGSASSGSVTGDASELEAAAEAMFEAFVRGDDDAWFDSLSRECREGLGFTAVQSYLDGRRFRISGAGIDLAGMGVSASTVSSFDGSEGEVLLLLSGSDQPFLEEQGQTWVFEDGGWFLDGCSQIEPADQLAGLGSERSAPAELGFVIDADGFLVTLYDTNLDNAQIVADLGGAQAVNGGSLATAQVTVTHTGAEPSIVLGDALRVTFVAGDTVYGEDANCAGSGDGFFDPTVEIARGDSSAFVYICREIDPDDGDGLLLRIESLASGDDWWFSLG